MSGDGLAELRARIDRIDESIVAAFAERFALSREAGPRKAGSVRDPGRESAVLAHVEATAAKLGLEPAYVSAIYEVVIEMSVQDQLEPGSGVQV